MNAVGHIRVGTAIAAALVCGLAGISAGPQHAMAQNASVAADPMDWPNWRGPYQSQVSREIGLVDSWNPRGGEGSNLIWKRDDLGSRSTPIVLGGRLYTIVRDERESKNEGEKVVCVDAATGNTIWEHRFNVYLSDVPDTRVGWSSCVGDPETGRIYVQGVCGYFCCLEGDTGRVVWERSLHEEFGLVSTYGGRTNVPVIHEDTVLISAVVVGWGDTAKWDGLARPAHRFMAFDKATGELRWLNGTGISPYDTTYSTPTLAVLNGVPAIVFGSGDGEIWALQAGTGKHIWHFPFTRRGANVSPTVDAEGRVFVGQSEENVVGKAMGALVALDGTMEGDLTGRQLWLKYGEMIGKASPVLVGDRLFVVDDGAKLFMFNANTGEQIARQVLGSAMRSTPLYADGKLYICDNNGKWFIFRPTETGFERIHQLRLNGEASDGSPIVSHGRIYLPTSENLYCIGDPSREPALADADTFPVRPLPPAPPAESDPQPAQIQVVPYDVLLKPGDHQAYRVRLFNSRGQFLREAPAGEVQFTLDGPGALSDDGNYTAPTSDAHEAALITCQVGGLAGTARARIVPPLPWKFDFNNADSVPLTWIGGRVRWEVRDENGERFIAKKTVLPTPRDPNNKLGTRSFIWMGHTDLRDYTIQADVQLQEENGRLPDVGLIASRYQLTIRAGDTLRLDSWTSSDFRSHAEVGMQVQPGAWYTLKLSVVPGDGTATVRGKVWQRDEPEPDQWTVEFQDDRPNLFGTPAVFGKSQEAEVYLDNLIVTQN